MFTIRSFWWSTVRHFARSNLAVMVGVALATAVISGALIVGDSVRASLRTLSLQRLGQVDHVVRGPRFFRQDLATQFSGSELKTVAPAIIVAGSVQTGHAKFQGSRRAGHVEVYGVDAAFWKLAEVEAPPTGMAISRRLAEQLQLKVGDKVSLVVEIPATIPRDALLGEREETVVELPTQISRIFTDDEMPGRFGLNPSQQLPLNAFVDLEELQTQLNLQYVPESKRRKEPEKPARINALFLQTAPHETDRLSPKFAEEMSEHLHRQLTLQDLSLRLLPNADHGYLSLESERMLLDDGTIAAAEKVARDNGWASSPVLISLLTEIENPRDTGRFSMYPISAGVGWDERRETRSESQATGHLPSAISHSPSFEPLDFAEGRPPQGLHEIAINDWLATDLAVKVGETVTLRYKVVGDTGELPELTRTATISGIVKLSKGSGDPGLVPYVAGISDAEDPTKWREPFPLKKDRITQRDRDYWKPYRTTPKVFWDLTAADELFQSRYGKRTSLRIAPPAGVELNSFREMFEKEWLTRLEPQVTGLGVEPVKYIGLMAAQGTTDFTGLFFGFSLFLIASALLLVSLLFRLGLESRSREFGLLMGVGWTSQVVGRQVLTQGLTLAAIGGVLGTIGGILYAGLMIYGLTTWWSGAVGTRSLFLHVSPMSLLVGWLIAVVISAILIARTSRQLRKSSPRTLLLGGGLAATNQTSSYPLPARSSGQKTLWISTGISSLLLVTGILGLVPSSEAFAGFSIRTVAFFVGGLSALVASLSALARWLAADSTVAVRGAGWAALARLALRNAARNRSRSLLTASLIASATFLVVAVASGRRNPAVEAPRRDSGNGGFTLVAETNQPVLYDLNTPSGRTKAGVNLRSNPEQTALLQQIKITSLRMRPGENASCLNLYQTQLPTILGVPQSVIDEFTREGRFKFADTRVSEPWKLLEGPRAEGLGPRAREQEGRGQGNPLDTAATLTPSPSPRGRGEPEGKSGHPPSAISHQPTKNEEPRTKNPPPLPTAHSPLPSSSPIPVLGDMNTLQYSLHKGIGSTIEIEDESRRKQSLVVRGMLDGSVFQGVLLMSEANLLRLFPDTPGFRYFLIEVDPAAAPQVTTLLETDLGDVGFDAERVADRLANFLSVQNTYLSTFQTLGGLGLLLGTVGLGVVMMRNVWERRSELALLRAVGYTSSMLRRVVLLENAFLLSFGLIAGTFAAAVAMAPHLLSIGADVSLPGLGLTILSVFAAGMLSSLAAVREVSRLPMLMALRSE